MSPVSQQGPEGGALAPPNQLIKPTSTGHTNPQRDEDRSAAAASGGRPDAGQRRGAVPWVGAARRAAGAATWAAGRRLRPLVPWYKRAIFATLLAAAVALLAVQLAPHLRTRLGPNSGGPSGAPSHTPTLPPFLLRLLDSLLPDNFGANHNDSAPLLGNDPVVSELLSVRDKLYLSEARLQLTEHALSGFRRRGDLEEASEELNARHKDMLGRLRGLAQEIHEVDESTGEVAASVQSRARQAIMDVARAARAITPFPDSYKEVFLHLRAAASANDLAADEVGQLAERYSLLARRAHGLQSDGLLWLGDARDHGGKLQACADKLRLQIDHAAAQRDPRYPTTAAARRDDSDKALEIKSLARVSAYLDDGAEVMTDVGGVLDEVMALLHEVRDHYRHRAQAYRDAVSELKALADEGDVARWDLLVRSGFGTRLVARASEMVARSDALFDRYVSFQAAAHARRVEQKRELFRRLESGGKVKVEGLGAV